MSPTRNLIAAARRWIRTAREFRQFAAVKPHVIRVDAPIGDACVDTIVIHRDGTIAAEGWAKELGAFRDALSLHIDGVRRQPTHVFRIYRADLESHFASRTRFLGAVAEWVLHGTQGGPASLNLGNRVLRSFDVPPTGEPPYGHLHTETRVLGREGIYGFGPPVPQVSPEVLALAESLDPPLLDFGCGAGAMVVALRRAGVEAFGLELDEGRIREHLLEEARPFVTLYDGALPAPFRDGQFRSVTCCEVVEHIPNPAAVVQELARLSQGTMLITVPDMSAIPRGFHHGVVPWHLLESTHVNFFTQHSLEQLLLPWVSRAEFSRIGLVQCDRLKYFTSLAVVAER
jgi:SAM-dependent methyltransferase